MKKGFTLAEVLITLVIIGVVAAITIPTMISSTDDREYNTAFKKSLSSLNQAMGLDRALYQTTIDAANLVNAFANNLNVINRVATGQNATQAYSASGVKLFTADGISYDFTAGACVDHATVVALSNMMSTACTAVIDVNGDAAPNEAGRDQQNVAISTTGVIPGDDAAKAALFSPTSTN